MAYVLALDQGTTSSRAILFDEAGAIAAVAQHEFQQFYPQAGWVEHDPFEILTSQISCAVEVLGKVGARPRDVASIGITNQRETVIVWERLPANLYTQRSSGRTAAPPPCALRLSRVALAIRSSAKPDWCSIPTSPAPRCAGFSTTCRRTRQRRERGELAFGTVDSWLVCI